MSKQNDDPKMMDLIYKGKTLPNCEALVSDPALGLKPYGTLHLVSKKHVGGMFNEGQEEEKKSAAQDAEEQKQSEGQQAAC